MNDSNTKVIAHKRRNKRLLLLFIMFGITLLILTATTYAWFVGLGEVKVNNFTVNLVTDPSLEISLDGYTWSENITITENTIKSHSDGGSAYEDNTNSWVGEKGLVPVSSSGDNTNGKLDIYSKSSLTSVDGGYRLTANKLDNSLKEKEYYVAFDIFVKNKTGDVYTTGYNLEDDENIYLTTDSSIIGIADGETSYGVQNSARVAFVQVGRISLDDLEDDTTPVIKCSTPEDGESYTPLCNQDTNSYRVMIWEPNELNHDTKVVNYYNLVCKKRTGTSTYTTDSCTDITAAYVPTYTIKKQIVSSDNVNIYDGLNTYTSNISLQTATASSLQNTITLTDTMKITEGQYTLMKLAPHSVTKIRVYVYLEGQDVDNYDLITNDLNIQVNFGFTKERTYTGEIVLDSYFDRAQRTTISDLTGYTWIGNDLIYSEGPYPKNYNVGVDFIETGETLEETIEEIVNQYNETNDNYNEILGPITPVTINTWSDITNMFIYIGRLHMLEIYYDYYATVDGFDYTKVSETNNVVFTRDSSDPIYSHLSTLQISDSDHYCSTDGTYLTSNLSRESIVPFESTGNVNFYYDGVLVSTVSFDSSSTDIDEFFAPFSWGYLDDWVDMHTCDSWYIIDKKLTFTGGEDATNSELIAWLEANGTLFIEE